MILLNNNSLSGIKISFKLLITEYQNFANFQSAL